MDSRWAISPAIPSVPTLLTNFITLSPNICTWKIQIEIVEALNALDASNLVLVYDSEKPVPCLGACPSSSKREDPLQIQGYKSISNPTRYTISVFYHGFDILIIESASPMPGEKAISGMIAVLIQELETTMDRGESLKPPLTEAKTRKRR